MKIALGMIVKHDELELLRTCLDSVIDHIDYAHISVNYKKGQDVDAIEKKVLEFSKGYKNADFDISEWTNFGEARNRNLKQITDRNYDFYLWLDADDTVENPEKLHQVAAATPNHISGVYLPYNYQHDEFGNVIVQHYVARLVRNDGTFAWSNKILHESLEPVRHCGKAMNDEVTIVHHADAIRQDESLTRNIEMLEKELKGEGNKPDARTLYYLGSAYLDANKKGEAKVLLSKYLQLSGWAEERAQAWVNLGRIFDEEGNTDEARKCFMYATVENPKDPAPYVELGKLEMYTEMYDKAIEWLTMSLAKKVDPMSTTVSGTEVRYRAHMYLADCYMGKGGKSIDLALESALKALKMRPDGPTRRYYEGIEQVIKQRDMTAGVVLTLKQLEEDDAKDKITPLIDNLPVSIQDNPTILRFRKRHTKPKQWRKKSIVIFTGNSIVGEWGPWSLKEGIGGSEEAVVRLSRQLKELGWEVWVYGNPGIRTGEYDGIQWRNYWELNLADTFDVFIGWRMPWFFDIKVNARKKYLWLHDVMEKEEFTKERLENIDKVIVLSKYHRSLFPMIPDDKIFLSANGIDTQDFEAEDGKHKRDPNRIIYMSSHVRGLQMLYHIWEDVKKAVPKASLDIYYGWGSYDAVNKGNPERMAWKQTMLDWIKDLKDVKDHGKVGQDVIVQEIFKSGVWAYPCPFPEISCISAMKAQAGGAIPVSSNFAALEETVQWGKKITMQAQDENTPVGKWDDKDLETFRDALIDTLKNQDEAERKKMMDWSRKNQSWQAVAKGWNDEFKS